MRWDTVLGFGAIRMMMESCGLVRLVEPEKLLIRQEHLSIYCIHFLREQTLIRNFSVTYTETLMKVLHAVWFSVLIVSLTGCAELFPLKESPLIRLPMGVGYDISDVPCEDIKKESLPKRLEELGIEFKWTDEEEGLLAIGPITDDEVSSTTFKKIRQTYYLTIVCWGEVTTSIKGEATLEGLNSDDEWIAITDAPTIEQYGMKFLKSLEL